MQEIDIYHLSLATPRAIVVLNFCVFSHPPRLLIPGYAGIRMQLTLLSRLLHVVHQRCDTDAHHNLKANYGFQHAYDFHFPKHRAGVITKEQNLNCIPNSKLLTAVNTYILHFQIWENQLGTQFSVTKPSSSLDAVSFSHTKRKVDQLWGVGVCVVNHNFFFLHGGGGGGRWG